MSGKWEWTEKPIGGCHLFDKEYMEDENKCTWALNPQYMLKLAINPNQQVRVKITLSRPDKLWKKTIGQDLVGSMIGFYVFAGNSQPAKETILNTKVDETGKDTTNQFVPWN